MALPKNRVLESPFLPYSPNPVSGMRKFGSSASVQFRGQDRASAFLAYVYSDS